MNRLLDIENEILNAQSGGQLLSFTLASCSTNQSILPNAVSLIPVWQVRKKEQEQQEILRQQAEQRRKEEELKRQKEEEKLRQLQAERVRRGTAEPIDLGLSVLWASHNIGARSCEQQGVYASYDQKTQALNMWGEDWRVPTLQEMMELMQRCQWQWASQNGMPGYLITGVTGKQIFLPACGSCVAMQYDSYGVAGRYWTDTIDNQYVDRAMYLEFSMQAGNLFSVQKAMQMSFRLVKNK